MTDFSSKVKEERRLATYHYYGDWEQDPDPDLGVEIQRHSVIDVVHEAAEYSKLARVHTQSSPWLVRLG